MVYSCNYPIWVTFDISDNASVSYNIQVNGNSVYNGTISAFDTSITSVRIDISNICREYLETFYEDIIQNDFSNTVIVPVHGNVGTSINVIVYGNEPDIPVFSGTVVYDYNTDYISELNDVRYLNNPITGFVDVRQKIPVSASSVNSSGNFEYYRNGTLISSPAIPTTTQHTLYWVDVERLGVQVGDTLRFGIAGGEYSEYTVVESCPHRFVLYYVNKAGGLDAILCGGRYIESWNPDRTDVRIYADRGNRTSFGQKRINAEIDHQWQLNTLFIKKENLDKIDELIYSPKVFIHDLDKDTITSCIITDTQYQVKYTPRYDVPFYTINVKESIKQLRR